MMEVVVKISNILNKLTFGCGLATLCFTLQASAYYGDDCCPTTCCQTTCCEDGPLSCNAFGIQIKGGVIPSCFVDQERTTFTNPHIVPSVYSHGKTPQFDKLYETPWQVGAELQWNASTHVQFFAEYAYFQAEGKKRHFLVGDWEFHEKRRKLETNAFYLGARYFFGNIWCSECSGSVAPFVGFKGGLVWRNVNNKFNDLECVTSWVDGKRNDRGVLSAGAQIGLDWSINCNWGVVFTVEAVGTESFGGGRHVEFNPCLTKGITNGNFGGHGRLFSVPVTIGVRYTF